MYLNNVLYYDKWCSASIHSQRINGCYCAVHPVWVAVSSVEPRRLGDRVGSAQLRAQFYLDLSVAQIRYL